MAAVKSRQNRPKKATSSRHNELKFGMATNNHRLFLKMEYQNSGPSGTLTDLEQHLINESFFATKF